MGYETITNKAESLSNDRPIKNEDPPSRRGRNYPTGKGDSPGQFGFSWAPIQARRSVGILAHSSSSSSLALSLSLSCISSEHNHAREGRELGGTLDRYTVNF